MSRPDSRSSLLDRAYALLESMASVPAPGERDRARAAVSAAEARMGAVDAALARAHAIETSRPRRAALVEIAQACAERGDAGVAERIAEELSAEPFRSRALAAVAAAGARRGALDASEAALLAMAHRSVARDTRRELALALAPKSADAADRLVDAIEPDKAARRVRVELRCAQARFREVADLVDAASTEGERQDLSAEAAVALASHGRYDDAWAMLDRLYDPFGGPHHRAVAAADTAARGADAVLARIESWAPDARLAGQLGVFDGLVARGELAQAEQLVLSVVHALVPCALLARIAIAAVEAGDDAHAVRLLPLIEDTYEAAEVEAARALRHVAAGRLDEALARAGTIDIDRAEGARARAARGILRAAADRGDEAAVDAALMLVRGPVAQIALLCAAMTTDASERKH